MVHFFSPSLSKEGWVWPEPAFMKSKFKANPSVQAPILIRIQKQYAETAFTPPNYRLYIMSLSINCRCSLKILSLSTYVRAYKLSLSTYINWLSLSPYCIIYVPFTVSPFKLSLTSIYLDCLSPLSTYSNSVSSLTYPIISLSPIQYISICPLVSCNVSAPLSPKLYLSPCLR